MKRSEYNHKKLTGNDVSIETSLLEYGFAWIEGKESTLFYYGIKLDNDSNYSRFDFCEFDNSLDVKNEFDWADFSNMPENFDDYELPEKIYELFMYYGDENVFGSAYYEGLLYPEVVNGGKLRLSDMEYISELLTAEQVADMVNDYEGVQNVRLINAYYRSKDESNLYPINGRFNATERAIRRIRRQGIDIYGLEYCYALESEISNIVNSTI